MKNSFTSETPQASNKTPSAPTTKKQYDHLFKIVIIGDSGVGKSCLLLRFADDQFNENFYSTIGVDFRFKCISLDNKNIKLQIWDTAGQERFKTITSAYYRGADGIIIVYDQSDKNSFYHLNDWINDVEKLTTDNPVKMVIANKSDLEDKQVTDEEKKDFTNRTGIEIIEASAKKSIHVIDAFERMTKLLITRSETKDSADLSSNYKLTPTPLEGRLSQGNTLKCCK